ncbi:hypothetical protein VTO73DRAFT_7639 [Trametes versicolor]
MRELPVELFDQVADYAMVGTVSRAEANEHRERLMQERRNFVVKQNEEIFEIEFNMYFAAHAVLVQS